MTPKYSATVYDLFYNGKFRPSLHVSSANAFKFTPPKEDWKKFYSQLPYRNKKPTKFLKQTSASKLRSRLKLDAGKKCCGNEWSFLTDKEAVNKFSEPVFGAYYYPSGQVFKYEDVKPVVEHIEDDLKYDFRTNTHSF